MRKILPMLIFIAFGQTASAEDDHKNVSKYAGQEKRAIKSLSADDIAGLQRGVGWGLATAAELNGGPGPIHLLELKQKTPPSPEQVRAITQIYDNMKTEAIEQGNRLIASERALDKKFREGTVTFNTLQASLSGIAETLMQLRLAHLATYLKTPTILTDEKLT